MTAPRYRPMAFTAFCARVLRLRLTRGQTVLAKVVFDGVEPGDLEGDEMDLARTLFGDVEVIPPAARRVLVLVLGRASGKSTLSAAYALWRMCVADCSRVGPGSIPTFVVVGPRLETAKIPMRMALAMVDAAPALKAMLRGKPADGFQLQRADGRLVAFRAIAASRGGAAGRGLDILGAILEEAQFFSSEAEFVVTDHDVYGGIAPRLMVGGSAVFISTPWPVPTLMGQLDEANFGQPATALVAHAPTLVMRDGDPEIAALIEAERARDPVNAAREFDCDTSATSGADLLFDPNAIAAAVDDELVLPMLPRPGAVVSFGGDLGFVSDSSAGAVVHKLGGISTLADLIELRPKKGVPLQPSFVVGQFADVAIRHGARYVIADRYYQASIEEHLRARHLAYIPAPDGASGKQATYLRARALLNEGKAKIPRHERLLAQLKAVISKPKSGGGISITSPRRTGLGHGDLVSALVLALWERGGSKQPGTTDPETVREQKAVAAAELAAAERSGFGACRQCRGLGCARCAYLGIKGRKSKPAWAREP